MSFCLFFCVLVTSVWFTFGPSTRQTCFSSQSIFFSHSWAELSWVEMGWDEGGKLCYQRKHSVGMDERTNGQTDTTLLKIRTTPKYSLFLPPSLSFSSSDYDLAFLYFLSLFFIQFLAVSQTSISLFLFFFSLSHSVSDFFNLSSQTFSIK